MNTSGLVQFFLNNGNSCLIYYDLLDPATTTTTTATTSTATTIAAVALGEFYG